MSTPAARMNMPIVPRRAPSASGPRAGTAAWGQALLYGTTGVWPLVSMRSFEAVTGPKEEDWLVETFGAVLAVVGATFALAAARGRVTRELRTLGIGCAAALAAADVLFVAQRRISPVYLLDAAAEAALIAAWAAAGDAAE
jgi:hypothetical protein